MALRVHRHSVSVGMVSRLPSVYVISIWPIIRGEPYPSVAQYFVRQ